MKKKTLFLFILDFLSISFMGLISHWLVFGTVHKANIYLICTIPGVFCLALLFAKFYRHRIANSSVELVRKALFVLGSCAIAVYVVIGEIYGFVSGPARWSITYSALAFLAIIGSRTIWRMLIEDKAITTVSSKPLAIIYGAGDLGSTMARQALKGALEYQIAGFIDDNEGLQDEIVMSYPVLGNFEKIESILKEYSKTVSVLIIAISYISAEKIQKAVLAAKSVGMEAKIVPNLFERRNKSITSIRDLNMEDLLGRQLDKIDKEPLFDLFSGKTILVTGAGGSIGSEICTQLLEYGLNKLILLDIDETELHDLALKLLDYEKEWSDKVVPVVCDIRNKEKVKKVFEKYKPDLVFHAAAYKHVPLMELYPEEAVVNNICGSYNVFCAAVETNVKKVVVISTDKAVNPTNVMGSTKRVVEMIAASMNNKSTEFCCVRFGNVIGSRGSMLPLFLDEIKAGKPITVTDRRIIRYFMAIPEAVSLVFRAASLASGGEVMVLDMGKPVNIYDFAEKLNAMFGDGRTAIKIIGLRPGEKMYEELLADKDNTIPTENKKIFKAKVNKSVLNKKQIEELTSTLPNKSPEEVVALLHELVPEFKAEKH